MYYLYLFASEGPFPERVVISDADRETVRADYGEWQERLEIRGDATSFPCDRALIHAY